MNGVLGQLREQIQGHEGRGWAGSVDDLLFDGERVRRSVSLGDNRVVVTSHRLLAFTPGRSGENYRQVDVPNVTDVRAGNEGESILVFQAARMYLYGGVLCVRPRVDQLGFLRARPEPQIGHRSRCSSNSRPQP